MATKVFLETVRAQGDEVIHIFRVIGNQQVIKVKSFEEGIAVIQCVDAEDYSPTAITIAGLFDKESNFTEELCKSFDKPEGETLKSIHLVNDSWPKKVEAKEPTIQLVIYVL